MKHGEIRWNPATQEWFCVRCGRTSDHTAKQDGEGEIEQFDCVPRTSELESVTE